jgi:N-acetylmuramoyl-L-alanine amidase
MTRLVALVAIVLALPLTPPGVAAQLPHRPGQPVIVIDPGHPSEVSSGAEVRNGTTEVKTAWEVARRLGTLLTAQGYRVVMTKSTQGELVTNVQRAEIGNREGAVLLVRLHCDAGTDSGFAIYHPDRPATVQGRTGPSESVIRRSEAAAESLHVSMARHLAGRLKDGGVRGDTRTAVGSEQGALTGSVFSDVPVVLVEMVTLSNPHDAGFIMDTRGQSLMAQAIAEGISRFAPASNSPRVSSRDWERRNYGTTALVPTRPDDTFTNARLTARERRNLDVVREAEAAKHTQVEPGDMRFYRARVLTAAMLGTHSPQDWEVLRAEVLAEHGYRGKISSTTSTIGTGTTPIPGSKRGSSRPSSGRTWTRSSSRSPVSLAGRCRPA